MTFQDKAVIKVIVEQLTKITAKLYPRRQLQITMTVSTPELWQGYAHCYTNTIRVRYPNLGRLKGEPREIEDIHVVWCCTGYLITKNGRSYLYSLPDMKVIEGLVSDYEKYGCVKLIRNDLYPFKIMKGKVSLVYHDGCKYDIKTK